MSKTERTQVLLTPAQRAKAERIAARQKTSIGAVLREALDAYDDRGADDRLAAVEDLLAIGAPVEDWPVVKAELLASRFDTPT